tara:strand:- start:433 stop:1206 length:774 start_codon:yes stop_codon:yes gene_type:complete
MDVPEGSQRQLDNRQKGNDTRINDLIEGSKTGLGQDERKWLMNNKYGIMDKMDADFYHHKKEVNIAATDKMNDYRDALSSAQRDSHGRPISGYGTQFRRGGPERARLRDEVKRGMMTGLTEEQALQNIQKGMVREAMKQYANNARAAIPKLVTSEYGKVVAEARKAAAPAAAAANAAALRDRLNQPKNYRVSGVDMSQGELNEIDEEAPAYGGKKKKTKKRKTNRKKAKAKTNKRNKHGRKSKTHKKRRYGRKSRRH